MQLAPEHVERVRAMKKKNAWADKVAVHVTANYLSRSVVVFSQARILFVAPDRSTSKQPIFISHEKTAFQLCTCKLGASSFAAANWNTATQFSLNIKLAR